MTENLHLTEDELDEFLLGSAPAALQLHVTQCDLCARRVASFQIPMELFNQASTSWSEARSNTLARGLPAQARLFTPAGALSFAATLCVGVVVAISAGLHQRSQVIQGAQPGVVRVAENSPQEIAKDNAMLLAIDSELTQPEPSPLSLYQQGGLPARRFSAQQD